MNIKSKKQARTSRVLREMYARHCIACRKWERQEIAASKCRYHGYITLALASASGQNVHVWPQRPECLKRGKWKFLSSGLNGHDISQWRGVRHWRNAKKLALRIATRPVTWASGDVRECTATVLPWRCA